MSKKTDFKVCRYDNCPHGKIIDITKDDYRTVGKTMYYHADCLKKKRKDDWKDEKTKSDLQYIKNQWVLHIDKTVIYSQLFRILNEFIARGISSEYLVFVLDYVIKNKMKLNYPNGLKYYVGKQEIKDAYKKSKIKKVEYSQFTVETSDSDEHEDTTPSLAIKNRPKGFASILQSKKDRRD